MAVPYAEVIGDPVSHSKSPLIHTFWLEKLGLAGDYRVRRLGPGQLSAYLREKREDRCWRGCSVTAPLKQKAAMLVGAPLGLCQFVGAVNCIVRTPLSGLVGTNTDLNGLAAALDDADLPSSKICLIGAGGAARAALCYLVQNGAQGITIVARDKQKAEALRRAAPVGRTNIDTAALADAAPTISAANILINATPMGMEGGPAMAPVILNNLSKGELVFDMVYAPLDTDLLKAARQAGAKTVDGLTMLIGQAAPAFELFFGAPAPRQYDGELRKLLTL